jgi:hypothetical protein
MLELEINHFGRALDIVELVGIQTHGITGQLRALVDGAQAYAVISGTFRDQEERGELGLEPPKKSLSNGFHGHPDLIPQIPDLFPLHRSQTGFDLASQLVFRIASDTGDDDHVSQPHETRFRFFLYPEDIFESGPNFPLVFFHLSTSKGTIVKTTSIHNIKFCSFVK